MVVETARLLRQDNRAARPRSRQGPHDLVRAVVVLVLERVVVPLAEARLLGSERLAHGGRCVVWPRAGGGAVAWVEGEGSLVVFGCVSSIEKGCGSGINSKSAVNIDDLY